MTPQHETDRFYWNCASGVVDVLRARLGIPEPVPFRPKASTPDRNAAAPADRSWLITILVVLVMAFCAWRKSA